MRVSGPGSRADQEYACPGEQASKALRLAARSDATNTTSALLIMNVAATANQDMLEEGAALRSSASSGKAAAKPTNRAARGLWGPSIPVCRRK